MKKSREPVKRDLNVGPKRGAGETRTGPGSVAARLQRKAGNRAVEGMLAGQPLDGPTRAAMEKRFGRNLGGVRVHTGPDAARSAESLGARAYTLGSDIVFGRDQYAPGDPAGDRLLAHELAHVMQQEGARPPAAGEIPIAAGQDAPEREALELSAPGAAPRVVARLPEQRIQRAAPETAPPVARPSLSDLRTIAQGYIGDYYSAIRGGMEDFEHDVTSSFDWGAFWLTVGGNVVWATASFATGGTAFIISLAGIAISTYASTAIVKSAADFHRESVKRLDEIVVRLNNEADRVTREVDFAAAERDWDDNRTRLELLHRLVQPFFTSVAAGGLPNLSQPKVAASAREVLLIQASQQASSPLLSPAVYRGVFREVWSVDGIDFMTYPYDGPTVPVLKPVSEWSFGFRGAGFENVPPEVPDLNKRINEIYETYGTTEMDPSVWPVEKEIRLDFGYEVWVVFHYDASNALVKIEDNRLRGILRARGYDPEVYLRDLPGQMPRGAIPRIWGGLY